MLNFKTLAESATSYGTPLYVASISHGTVSPGEYEFNATHGFIIIADGEEKYNIFVKQSRLDEGIDPEKDTLEISDFVAQRDADGKRADGSVWNVEKGAKKTLAH